MDNTQVVHQQTGKASNDAFTGLGDRFLAALLLWLGILFTLAGIGLGIFHDPKWVGLVSSGLSGLLFWVVFGRLGRYGSIVKNG